MDTRSARARWEEFVVKHPSLFRAAVAAPLYFSACTSGDIAEDVPPPPSPEAPPALPGPMPMPPEPGGEPEAWDGPCRVDADCGRGEFCGLRLCLPGCMDAGDCDVGEACDPHGRCGATPEMAVGGIPTLSERQTRLATSEIQARVMLRNDGDASLKYRLAATNPALGLDGAPAELAPGAEIELVVVIDHAAVTAADHSLPIQIVTSGGLLYWSIELDDLPEAGSFRGSVSFESEGHTLASSDLGVDLDFRDDGTIAGRVDADASLLWPLSFAIGGTWTSEGAVNLVLRDRVAADDWRLSPLARELVREFVLTGQRSPAGIEGTLTVAITGLRTGPVHGEGAFVLRRAGPPTGLVHAPEGQPKDAEPPTWLAPAALDLDACDDLGELYGTDATLAEPEPSCDACANGSCAPDDMTSCAVALHDAAYHLPNVLAALGGSVKPPTGAWTWADCTAESPSYDDDGAACLDIAALRCADSLLRRGSVQTEGPWSEALQALAAIHANDEATAAMLLSSEAQIDAAFAYKDEIGEPVADVMARELAILAADRERLAAALAPTLAPAYPAGLAWIGEHSPDLITASAPLAPLRLATAFADTTAAWARLAHRAGA